MSGYFLKNEKGEYLSKLDGANHKLEFTTDVEKAKNYAGMPGGGFWDAENEQQFIQFHFKDEYKERVTTLKVVDN